MRVLFIFGGIIPASFFVPETDPCMSSKCPVRVLSDWCDLSDNITMKELMQMLKALGLPAEERKRIRAYYIDDPDGLRQYVLYMRAIHDDRHEYI